MAHSDGDVPVSLHSALLSLPVISMVYGIRLYFYSQNALKENLYPACHPADTEFQWRMK